MFGNNLNTEKNNGGNRLGHRKQSTATPIRRHKGMKSTSLQKECQLMNVETIIALEVASFLKHK